MKNRTKAEDEINEHAKTETQKCGVTKNETKDRLNIPSD